MKCPYCCQGNPDDIEDESHHEFCPIGRFAWNDPRRKIAVRAFDDGDYDRAKVTDHLDPHLIFDPEMEKIYWLGADLGGPIAASTPPA